MDLIRYSKERFEEIAAEIKQLTLELSLENVKIIPISATEGDNLTKNSKNITWYTEEPLLTYLENVDTVNSAEEDGFYMPVQRVCRPNHTFRGFQGQIEAGTIKVGDELITLPSNEKAIVKSIHITDREADQAIKGQPVTIQLNKEVDVSRGCVLTKNAGLTTSKTLTATLLWMDDAELTPDKNYFVKIGTKLIPGLVTGIRYKIDVNSGEHKPAVLLKKNEIAVCDIVLAEKIVADRFHAHKTLGELILIDRITNMTSACGVIEELVKESNLIEDSATFIYENIRARGDIFEEFYYNLESLNISKLKPENRLYTLGDVIPVKGESYHYPENFDILVLRDWTVIKIRDSKIEAIKSIDDFHFSGVPLINGRGFSIQAATAEEAEQFLKEYKASEGKNELEFTKKWIVFETYRSIVFNSNFWVI
jgi:sulfate adenylyltransferase subunit 1